MEINREKIVWILAILIISLIVLEIVAFQERMAIKIVEPQYIGGKIGLIRAPINIVCSINHNHPLLQGQEYCIYNSKVREKLGID